MQQFSLLLDQLLVEGARLPLLPGAGQALLDLLEHLHLLGEDLLPLAQRLGLGRPKQGLWGLFFLVLELGLGLLQQLRHPLLVQVSQFFCTRPASERVKRSGQRLRPVSLSFEPDWLALLMRISEFAL